MICSRADDTRPCFDLSHGPLSLTGQMLQRLAELGRFRVRDAGGYCQRSNLAFSRTRPEPLMILARPY